MTDAEKITRMVEWMGGWPEHKRLPGASMLGSYCDRCEDFEAENVHVLCRSFNPFERIEDAFLLAHKIKASFDLSINWSRGEDFWLCDIDGYVHLSESPARAIAEAAWQVISRLDPDRGSSVT
jgi:hypothetical protein